MFNTLLSHFNGSNGQMSYTAESGQVWTFNGNARLDTSQKKFGTSSLYLDGNDDYVRIPDSENWNFGSGDFTVDFWFKSANSSDHLHFLCAQANLSLSACSFFVQFSCRIVDDHKFCFGVMDTDLHFYSIYSDNTYYNDTDWHHLAGVRNGSTFMVFIDGIKQSTVHDLGTKSIMHPSGTLGIGTYGDYTAWQYCAQGWFDEFRVSKGVAIWTANFTPPTIEHTNSSSYLNPDTINRGGVAVTCSSIINAQLLLSIPMIIADSNFSSESKWKKIVVIYKHSSGQVRRITHKKIGGRWVGNCTFPMNSNTGVWQKMKVVLMDNQSKILVLNRSNVGATEDITVL